MSGGGHNKLSGRIKAGFFCSYLLNTTGLLSMCCQLLPQPFILHQEQFHLAGLLQASRGQTVEGIVTWNFSWLTTLDIPVRDIVELKQNLNYESEFGAESA